MIKIKCEDCEGEISIPASIQIDEKVMCQHCGLELIVTALDPIEYTIIEDEK